MFQFVEAFDLNATPDDLWETMVQVIIPRGVQAHQLPMEVDTDNLLVATLTMALKQLSKVEVLSFCSLSWNGIYAKHFLCSYISWYGH